MIDADLLPPSAIITAATDIRDHLRSLVYNNGERVFRNPERNVVFGMYLGLHTAAPTADDTPAIRIWLDQFSGNSENVQFFLSEYRDVTLSLYLYLYSMDDVTDYRQRLCEHILRYLQEPESGVTDETGLMPRLGMPGTGDYVWSFAENQIVTVDHTNIYKEPRNLIVLDAPWYGSRIDLQIRARNLQPFAEAP